MRRADLGGSACRKAPMAIPIPAQAVCKANARATPKARAKPAANGKLPSISSSPGHPEIGWKGPTPDAWKAVGSRSRSAYPENKSLSPE